MTHMIASLLALTWLAFLHYRIRRIEKAIAHRAIDYRLRSVVAREVL